MEAHFASSSLVSLPGQQPPWHGFAGPAGSWAPCDASATPVHHSQHYSAAAATPPRSPAVFHTTESLVLESSPSKDGSTSDSPYQYAPPEQQWRGLPLESPPPHPWGPPPLMAAPQPPYWVQQPQQQHQHQHQHQHRQQLELERQNAALAQRCQELQGELEATAAAAAQLSAGLALASPGGSTQTSQKQHPQEQTPQRQQRSATHTLGDGEVDREELALLQRRLAAKQREVEAAAAAVGAKRAQAAQLQAELEEARGLAAALSDELARWKGECAQVGAGGWASGWWCSKCYFELCACAFQPCVCLQRSTLANFRALTHTLPLTSRLPPCPAHSASASCARCSSAWRQQRRTPATWKTASLR